MQNPTFDPFIMVWTIGALLGLVFGICVMMLPFLIVRIRNEIIQTNKQLGRIIDILKSKKSAVNKGEAIEG